MITTIVLIVAMLIFKITFLSFCFQFVKLNNAGKISTTEKIFSFKGNWIDFTSFLIHIARKIILHFKDSFHLFLEKIKCERGNYASKDSLLISIIETMPTFPQLLAGWLMILQSPAPK